MRLDPRTKLFVLGVTSISIFLNGSLIVEAIFVAVPLLLLLLARQWKKAIFNAAFFGALLALQLWLIPLMPVAAGGIVYTFDVYIRKLIPCFMLGSYLIGSTKVSAFLAAVGKLHLPRGFTIALSITLRYFPTMGEEWRAIKDAMALRGISSSFGGMLLHPLKSMEYVYVPMLVSASRISNEISQAAITRGIDHKGKRSCLERIRFSVFDLLLALLYVGIIVLMILAPKLGVR